MSTTGKFVVISLAVPLAQELAHFPMMRQVINILGFVAMQSQLYHYSSNAAIDSVLKK